MRNAKLITLFCFAFACALPASAPCDNSTELMPAIQIEDALRGILVTKRARFVIKDIRIGNTSVRDLFSDSDAREISGKEYFTWERETIEIKLKEDMFLSRLKYIALTNDSPVYLSVDLIDPKEGGPLRWLREHAVPLPFRGFALELKYPIVIKLPLCDRVTQVIFNGIDSHLQKEIERAGQSEKPITLDQLFTLLRSDRLEAYMDTLGPIDRKCPGAFRLLEWVRDKPVHGFDYERYSVKPELGSVLASISKSVAHFQKWRLYHFQISVVGYTDPYPVDGISLVAANTGVKSLATRPSLKVYYAGCRGDHLSRIDPYYVDYFSSDGQLVESWIRNNCELGAVRAYAATAFIVEKLGRRNMSYQYASGGISPSGTEDDLKRKVDLRIVVKAASLASNKSE